MAYDSPRHKRRREKLRELLQEFGGQTQVALEIGTPKSHLSAILAGRRGVGDELAKKLETTYAKPPGWMDEGTEAASLSTEALQVAQEIDSLPQSERKRVLSLCHELLSLARESASGGVTEQPADARNVKAA